MNNHASRIVFGECRIFGSLSISSLAVLDTSRTFSGTRVGSWWREAHRRRSHSLSCLKRCVERWASTASGLCHEFPAAALRSTAWHHEISRNDQVLWPSLSLSAGWFSKVRYPKGAWLVGKQLTKQLSSHASSMQTLPWRALVLNSEFYY